MPNYDLIREQAIEYYKSNSYCCAETVVKTLRDAFDIPCDDNVIAMASGFSGGIGGAGCICGSVAGAVMILGLLFGRTKANDPQIDKCKLLAKELHDYFKAKNGLLCCRVHSKRALELSITKKEQCTNFTADVAVFTAELIVRESGDDPLAIMRSR